MNENERTTGRHRIRWPDGKDFAFTIFDDTDLATVANVSAVYDFLGEQGVRTTKSVWPLGGDRPTRLAGETSDDRGYLDWTKGLQASGFEIGYHGASHHTLARDRIAEGLERFRDHYGHYPYSMANHSGALESIYWGAARVTGIHQAMYHAMTLLRRRDVSHGHIEGDPLFWGDLCQEKVRYVRNFTFSAVDTLAACPIMPYHDPDRPYVNDWFASSEGTNVRSFNACLDEESQDELERNGGACIMYTHFASGFWRDGSLDGRFQELIGRLAGKNGWFVPVRTLLDHIKDARGPVTITDDQRRALERRWLRSKAKVGMT